jgi:RluA family pseudouridine synthase
VARPKQIELADGTVIPILYEDRSIIAIDKPAGWMLVPYNWDKTDRNLHLAISSSIQAGDFWSRSRGLRYLRHVHRLDADTSGILLMARSPGALHTFSRLFESRSMQKTYLAVVATKPAEKQWSCNLRIGPDARQIGRMRVDPAKGKEAETRFRVVESLVSGRTLIEGNPVTGRTHQIRVHLAAAGHPVIGDELYGKIAAPDCNLSLGLRAVGLSYRDPFRKCPVKITAPEGDFRSRFGFPIQ